MPFKDIATSDSIYLPEVPKTDDTATRRSIKRLQDVAVGVFAPISELNSKPLPNAIAIVSLDEIAKAGKLPPLPQGAVRYAIKVTGLEDAKAYSFIGSATALVATVIIDVPGETSRVHASRRVFQLLSDMKSVMPVVHSMSISPKDKDELILRCGSEAGALLVDGLGDGVMISAPNFDLNLLRQTSFNLLQVESVPPLKNREFLKKKYFRIVAKLNLTTES